MRILIIIFLICFSNQSLSQKSNLISIDINHNNFSGSANLTITNKDIFPHIILVKIYNTGDDVLVSEFSSTIAENSIEKFEIKAIGNIKFGSSLRWIYYEVIGIISEFKKDNNFSIPFPANHDVLVCQSSDGPQSTHKNNINAIDFCVQEKTPIVAAKDGTVITVVQNFTEVGINPRLFDKANYIEILHDNGLISSYSHIFTNSSGVKVGDKVKQGQQIALVGSVGYSSGPHLHFEVMEGLGKLNKKNELRNVIPIKFFNINNEEIKIKNNYIYDVNGFSSKANNSEIQSKLIENNSDEICGGISLKDDKAKAIDCYSKNQYKNAILHFEKHTKKFPNDSSSLARLGILYARLAVIAFINAIKQEIYSLLNSYYKKQK